MRLPALRPLLLSVVLALFAVPASAAPPVDEIDHLLGFIAASPCAFIRNDAEYSGPEAVAHIQDKYDYYRDEIATAEDFITLAASKSMLSGRPYLVRCGDESKPAGDWLLHELTTFRGERP